jgi:hypothetical protein
MGLSFVALLYCCLRLLTPPSEKSCTIVSEPLRSLVLEISIRTEALTLEVLPCGTPRPYRTMTRVSRRDGGQEQQATTGFVVREGTTATKTETPLIHVPQAIQVLDGRPLRTRPPRRSPWCSFSNWGMPRIESARRRLPSAIGTRCMSGAACRAGSTPQMMAQIFAGRASWRRRCGV